MVGGFLTLSNEYCFVVEDDTGICGYALAALDAQQFNKKLEIAWKPELCLKYPAPTKEPSEMLTPAEVCIDFPNLGLRQDCYIVLIQLDMVSFFLCAGLIPTCDFKGISRHV